jgi:non-canonical poly(A) RNA polymerase PAPD5/7
LNGGAPHSGTGVSGAPTGPRFSHHTNLHNNQTLHARTDFQNNPDDVGHQNLGGPVTDRSHQARADRNGQISNENLSFDSNIPRADRTLAIDSRPSKSVNLDTISDPALGSRKRNIRDEIKPAPILHRIGRGVSKKPVNGNVLKEWEPLADVSGTPWVEIDHSDTANMGLWCVTSCLYFRVSYISDQD